MTKSGDILLIANNFPPVRGGSAAVYESLARAAAGRIMVLAPRTSYVDGLPLIGWREHDRHAPYRIFRLAELRTRIGSHHGILEQSVFRAKDALIRFAVAWNVLRIVLRQRPRAICVGELLASSWIIQLFALVPGLRTLVYVHGEEITTRDVYDPLLARRRRALLAADRIIVVSRFTRAAVLDLLGEQTAERIVLIGNGVDTARFHPSARRADLVSCYGLQGMFVFITVCRLLEKKGVHHALRAFAQLREKHPDTRFVIVGTGPYEETLRALASGLGITDAVVFIGDVAEDELAEHYHLGNVFVMPNRAMENGDTEGFGMVFLEANACGLPVIAGLDGGTSDAVRDGENGLLVDGRSVPAILDAMTRLREDGALRTHIACQGLQAAAAADWQQKADQFALVCAGG